MTGDGRPTDGQRGRADRATAALRLALTVGALVVGEAVLWRAGTVLPSLPLERAGLLRTFLDGDPLGLAVSLVRLLALGVGGGLLTATALGVGARACGAARLVTQLDRWTPPGLRRLLDGALGVGLAATIGLTTLPAGAESGRRPAPAAATIRRLADAAPTSTLRRLPDAPPPAALPGAPPTTAGRPASTLRRLPDAAAGGGPASSAARPPPTASSAPASPPPASWLRRLPDAGPAEAPTRPDRPPPPPGPEAPPSAASRPAAPPPVAAPIADAEVVVRPGDSFWRLAERHEAARLGRAPTEVETGACWQKLVALNRSRLAVPDDPDLLFPGQVLLVPCT